MYIRKKGKGEIAGFIVKMGTKSSSRLSDVAMEFADVDI